MISDLLCPAWRNRGCYKALCVLWEPSNGVKEGCWLLPEALEMFELCWAGQSRGRSWTGVGWSDQDGGAAAAPALAEVPTAPRVGWGWGVGCSALCCLPHPCSPSQIPSEPLAEV